MSLVGIDFGASGAAITINKSFEIVDHCLFDKTTIFEWLEFFNRNRGSIFAVEKVGGVYGDGAKSLFSFGHNVGRQSAAIELSGARVLEISPASWSGFYKLKYGSKFNVRGVDNKTRNENFISSEFPGVLSDFKRVKRYHSGAVDAYLIARYAIINLEQIILKNTKQIKASQTKKKSAPKASFI